MGGAGRGRACPGGVAGTRGAEHVVRNWRCCCGRVSGLPPVERSPRAAGAGGEARNVGPRAASGGARENGRGWGAADAGPPYGRPRWEERVLGQKPARSARRLELWGCGWRAGLPTLPRRGPQRTKAWLFPRSPWRRPKVGAAPAGQRPGVGGL